MSKVVQSKSNVRDLVFNLIPRRHLLAVLFLLSAMVIVALVMPDDSTENSVNLVNTQLRLPNQILPEISQDIESVRAPEIVAEVETQPVGPQWKEYQIQSGDNLSILFRRAGLNDKDIYELTSKAPEAKDLRRIRPGQGLSFLVENGKLQGLKYSINRLDSISFTRVESNNFAAEKISLKPESRMTFHQAVITSSLYMAGKRAGIPNALTMDMANIFGWDIDFALAPRSAAIPP